MNGDDDRLQELLDRIPSLEQRATVREFAVLEPDEQLVRLFVDLGQLQGDVRQLQGAGGVKAHFAQAGYTTAAIAAAAWYALTGGKLGE